MKTSPQQPTTPTLPQTGLWLCEPRFGGASGPYDLVVRRGRLLVLTPPGDIVSGRIEVPDSLVFATRAQAMLRRCRECHAANLESPQALATCVCDRCWRIEMTAVAVKHQKLAAAATWRGALTNLRRRWPTWKAFAAAPASESERPNLRNLWACLPVAKGERGIRPDFTTPLILPEHWALLVPPSAACGLASAPPEARP